MIFFKKLKSKIYEYNDSSKEFIILINVLIGVLITYGFLNASNMNHVIITAFAYIISLILVLKYGTLGLLTIFGYFIITDVNLIKQFFKTNNPIILQSLIIHLTLLIMFIIISIHIEKKRAINKELQRLSYHDQITDIPNYRYFLDRFNEEYRKANRHQYNLGLIIFDIDNFKHFNDELGHQFGDKILRNIAQKISNVIRKEDIICRYGGDEFLIILPFVKRKNLELIAGRIKNQVGIINTELDIPEEFYLSISLGYSEYPSIAMDNDELFVQADKALNEAKKNGKGILKTFNPIDIKKAKA